MNRRWLFIAIALCVLVSVLLTAGVVLWMKSSDSPQAAGLKYRTAMTDARRLVAQGKLDEAERLCRDAISLKTNRPDAFLLAAQCARARSDFDRALQDLSHVASSEQESWGAATLLKADILHYDTAEFQRAESAYREVLSVEPFNIDANSGCARLLGLCGRRTDAIPMILKLIQQSTAGDLLVLLSRQEGALTDPDLIAKAEQSATDDPNLWFAKANLALLNLEHSKAVGLLKTALSKPNAPALLQGRLGAELLAADQKNELIQWANSLPDSSEWSAETWLVIGQISELQTDHATAIRCYWETLRREPESLKATSRLATLLEVEGQADNAIRLLQRVTKVTRLRDAQRQAIMSSNPPTADNMLELVESYAECGRVAEAFAWSQAAAELMPMGQEFNAMRNSWAGQLQGPSIPLTLPEFNPALAMDCSEFPVPTRFARFGDADGARSAKSITFQKETDSAGFQFRYFSTAPKASQRMFEFTGGGVGVLDLDNDDWPDCVCTQGYPWAESEGQRAANKAASKGRPEFQDTVFRNRRGETFSAVEPNLCLPWETGFGQGISAGDINNDGFQDLYVSNTDRNKLLVNNGDGTFSEAEGYSNTVAVWTTSCLIADLNNDGFPDLYDVNYLTGDDVFTRVCETDGGQPLMCGPEAFEGAADCVWLNDGRGNLVQAGSEFLSPQATGKGLGIVAFRQQQQSALSVFVANDTVANHFFVPEFGPAALSSADQPLGAATNSADRVIRMKDQAFSAGLAVNADGKSEACMGIAVSDINGDHRMDLVVTNFLHESNTVYASLTDTLFQDQTKAVGLQEVSLPVLSFGTQFLDANNDGLQELFVGNGYTEDVPGNEVPYAMRPQLFEWMGGQFRQLPEEAVGTWGTEEIVARTVSRLDWNADGLPDLTVGLLDAPSFLLTNQSDAAAETGLAVRLVATKSARDAIGTTVTSTVDGQSQTLQLTAGDGYQCSNQRILHFSGRQKSQVSELTVRWPSGETQVFRDIPAAGCWVAVQGRAKLGLIPLETD